MTKKLLTVHGKKARSPFSERIEDGGCSYECAECGTGVVCARDTNEHYCAWRECPVNDCARFNAEYPH